MNLRLLGLVWAFLALSGCGFLGERNGLSEQERTTLSELARSGRADLDAGNVDRGMEQLRQVLRRDRESLDALNGLALGYAMQGRLDLASIFADRAGVLDPVEAMEIADLEQISRSRRNDDGDAVHFRLASLSLYGPIYRNVMERVSGSGSLSGGREMRMVGVPLTGQTSAPVSGSDLTDLQEPESVEHRTNEVVFARRR